MDIWDKRRRNLKAWMAIHGYNGTQVARDAELSINTVNKFLRGETKTIRWNTLDKICKTIGIKNTAVLDSDNPFSDTKNKLYEVIENMSDDEAEKALQQLSDASSGSA